MIVKVGGKTGEEIAKRMMFLAYEAAQVFGMGAMQAVDGATEEQVWERIVTNADRLVSTAPRQTTTISADYCYGRMMKIGCEVRGDHIEIIGPSKFTRDYQSWCHKYPTANDLGAAVIASLVSEPVAA